MSWEPQNQKGYVVGYRCPYCSSPDIEYIGGERTESGILFSYEVAKGECRRCHRKVMMVSKIETTHLGCYKGE